MSKDRGKDKEQGKDSFPALWLFGIGVVSYLAISYGIYLWLQGEALPPNAETAGVLIQATLAAAAIFGVSLALLRIAHNSGKISESQVEVAKRQRDDDQIEFLEAQLEKVIRPYSEIAIAIERLILTIHGLGVVASRDESPEFWENFATNYKKEMEHSLGACVGTLYEWQSNLAAHSIYSVGQSDDDEARAKAKENLSCLKEIVFALAQLSCCIYADFVSAVDNIKGDPQEKAEDQEIEDAKKREEGQKRWILDMAVSPHLQLVKMLRAANVDGFANITNSSSDKEMKEFSSRFLSFTPGILQLKNYLDNLLRSRDSSIDDRIYIRLPTFNALLARCGIKAKDGFWDNDGKFDINKFNCLLERHNDESREKLWYSDSMIALCKRCS